MLNLLNKNIDLLFTVLQLWNLYGFVHRLHNWSLPLRQDKKFEDLVDELQLLNHYLLEHGLYCLGFCRIS